MEAVLIVTLAVAALLAIIYRDMEAGEQKRHALPDSPTIPEGDD